MDNPSIAQIPLAGKPVACLALIGKRFAIRSVELRSIDIVSRADRDRQRPGWRPLIQGILIIHNRRLRSDSLNQQDFQAFGESQPKLQGDA
jgi:hypothetical protein